MKKLVLVLVMLTFTANAQWTKGTEKDPFKGDYKYTLVKGYGGDSPYRNPLFVINRIGDGEPNIYISNMGSLACDPSMVKIVVNTNPDKIYTFSLDESTDRDSGFLHYSTSDIVSLLDDFKKGSKATLKFTTGCSENTFVIGLSGSTNGINYVLGDYFKDILDLEKIEKDKESQETDIRIEESINEKIEKSDNWGTPIGWRNSINDSINSFYNKYTITTPKEELSKIIFKKIMSPYLLNKGYILNKGNELEIIINYYNDTNNKSNFIKSIGIDYEIDYGISYRKYRLYEIWNDGSIKEMYGLGKYLKGIKEIIKKDK